MGKMGEVINFREWLNKRRNKSKIRVESGMEKIKGIVAKKEARLQEALKKDFLRNAKELNRILNDQRAYELLKLILERYDHNKIYFVEVAERLSLVKFLDKVLEYENRVKNHNVFGELKKAVEKGIPIEPLLLFFHHVKPEHFFIFDLFIKEKYKAQVRYQDEFPTIGAFVLLDQVLSKFPYGKFMLYKAFAEDEWFYKAGAELTNRMVTEGWKEKLEAIINEWMQGIRIAQDGVREKEKLFEKIIKEMG